MKKEGSRYSRHWSRIPPAAHGGDCSEEEFLCRGGIHSAACAEPQARAGGYTLKKAAAHGEPMQEQDPGRNCDLCMACAGAVHAEVLYCTERMRAGAAGKCAEGVLEI